jgi:hypothetical protein
LHFFAVHDQTTGKQENERRLASEEAAGKKVLGGDHFPTKTLADKMPAILCVPLGCKFDPLFVYFPK